MNNAGSPFLAGIISQTNLVQAESELKGDLRSRLLRCNVLEIRYDLFNSIKEWPSLVARVRAIHPKAKIIGTIRLKKDGGLLEDSMANQRMPFWNSILDASEVPSWLDLEQFALDNALPLKEKADSVGTRLFISKHDFIGIPSSKELTSLAEAAIKVKACGVKVAAMSHVNGDVHPLYNFLNQIESHFDIRACFAMGKTGSVSRVWSLAMGANLTYGAISDVSVPGLLSVEKMSQAINYMENCETEEQMCHFLEK